MKKVIIAIMLAAMLATTPARGEPVKCKDVIAACDKALADSDKVIVHKNAEIKVNKEIIAAQDVRIVELEKQNKSIFKNPWLYLGLGILTGVLIAK